MKLPLCYVPYHKHSHVKSITYAYYMYFRFCFVIEFILFLFIYICEILIGDLEVILWSCVSWYIQVIQFILCLIHACTWLSLIRESVHSNYCIVNKLWLHHNLCWLFKIEWGGITTVVDSFVPWWFEKPSL